MRQLQPPGNLHTMTQSQRALPGLLLLSCVLALSSRTGLAKPATRLPDRVLTCSIRHITNYDPAKEQTAAQLRFDSVHSFVLHLPPISERTTRPPETFETAEPVDPRTRILADPDQIAPQPQHHFDRVIDIWPGRVELASTISGNLLNVIVINAFDPASGAANMFMTRATELTHFDSGHIYQGSCRTKISESALRGTANRTRTR